MLNSPYLNRPIRTLEEVMATRKSEDFVVLASTASEADVSALLMEIAETDGKVDAIKAQIEKLNARKASAEKGIELRRNCLAKWMQANGHKSLRLPEATVTMRDGKAKVIINDQDSLPLDCLEQVVTVKVNKKLIEAKLLTGQEVDGATLSNAEPVLSIRF